jgi:5'-methylthioadenosine phosphorylase
MHGRRTARMSERVSVAVIGGSGLYQLPGLKNAQSLELETPFGPASAPILVGELDHRRIAFLARHGIGHHLTPTEVPYLANIFALKTLGVERIISISACGSLREDYVPGEVVVPDQLVDFTKGRRGTFFGEGLVAHVSVPDPFCPDLSPRVVEAVRVAGGTVHGEGTLVTIDGPRFSTRAESRLFRQWTMSIIGMTTAPEAFLAREAEICYAVMAHITDYDVWHTSAAPVTVDAVVKTLRKNTALAQLALGRLLQALPDERMCECHQALAGAIITQPHAMDPATLKRLEPLVGKYLNA